MQEFKVTIENFEGPLDLMLHLIKEKQLDLFDLDVNVLTDQYIRFLDSMAEMHLEIAGEYMAELAELIEYKSRRLLPDNTKEETEEEDPKERLVRRLLEYQQYKEISSCFGQMYEDRQLQMTKPPSGEVDVWRKSGDDEPYEGNPNDLLKALKRCFLRMRLTKPIETRYTAKEISMEDRKLEIQARLADLPETFRFETLLEDCTDIPSLIATFLAILDLARLHTLVFAVDENEHIWFSKGTGKGLQTNE